MTSKRETHPDRPLVKSVVVAAENVRPRVLVLENVPLLAGDQLFIELRRDLQALGYDTESRIIRYADYGAATSRRRLFFFAVRDGTAAELIAKLETSKEDAVSVNQAISRFVFSPEGSVPDHTWPNFRTIGKYADKYASGKFGWYKLKAEEPAPSFGNITKTYILHPNSFNGLGPRVLSVREAMSIMGFDISYVFPDTITQTAKYRMVADCVNPVFSGKLAKAIKAIL
jgi:DNA (cytosine-5)-methyltransferase 1